MPPSFININGQLLPASAPAIAAASRAFRYGYGLFETMLVRDGCIRLEAYHWQRLQEGMRALGIAAAPDFFQKTQDAIRQTLRSNGHERLARLRLQVWPGDGGYVEADGFEAEFCVDSAALSKEAVHPDAQGLVAGIAARLTKHADELSHIKSCNALPYALAARQARANGWDEALLLNQYGRIAEGSVSNLFWISKEKIFTPPLSEGCVAGVMRRHLLHVLPAAGYAVEEAAAAPENLLGADAILLSNAVRAIRSVGRLSGREISSGIAAELQQKVLMSF